MSMTLARQGGSYLLVGGVQFAIDWALLVGLSAAGVPVVMANVGGRIAGALVGFWLNGRVTFAEDGRSRCGPRHLGRFVVAWIVLTLISTVLIGLVARELGLRNAWLAKPLVECGMALIGFAVSRVWIYR
ncbi:GtrA family protein [Coralloluteibacterium thermophilus]|uniref:GtrA family protein n=1 Tax=Coralloluteibacterium thermophilum TaxID=2707049 RepID=A0ABV9NL98_9GAMM